MRLIPLKILTMEQLGLPPVFRDISDAHKGLVLVTGPTGSGKSTTMAAMVDFQFMMLQIQQKDSALIQQVK